MCVCVYVSVCLYESVYMVLLLTLHSRVLKCSSIANPRKRKKKTKIIKTFSNCSNQTLEMHLLGKKNIYVDIYIYIDINVS